MTDGPNDFLLVPRNKGPPVDRLLAHKCSFRIQMVRIANRVPVCPAFAYCWNIVGFLYLFLLTQAPPPGVARKVIQMFLAGRNVLVLLDCCVCFSRCRNSLIFLNHWGGGGEKV